jgi:hypothetical protein
MHYVILTATQRAIHPGVHQVKGQRRVNAFGRMQGGGRLPRLVAHAGYELTHIAGGAQWNLPAVARDDITVGRKTRGLDLQPFDRGIHEPHGAAGCAFFSHDVPRLERLP